MPFLSRRYFFGVSIASDSSANDGKEEAQLELSSHSSFDDLLCETVTTTRVSPLHRSSFVSRVWYCALALSALLDFASSWTHQIEVERWGEFWAVSHSKRHPNYKRDMTFIPLPTFWATLAANSALFSLLFSCLWFMELSHKNS